MHQNIRHLLDSADPVSQNQPQVTDLMVAGGRIELPTRGFSVRYAAMQQTPDSTQELPQFETPRFIRQTGSKPLLCLREWAGVLDA